MAISGIYGLLDPNTNELRYIGQSIDIERRYKSHLSPAHLQVHTIAGQTTRKNRWLKKILTQNKKPILIIIEICEKPHFEEAEKFYISYFSAIGAKLTNSTEGGEAPNGYKHSPEILQIMSERIKRAYTPELRKKVSDMRKGQEPWNKNKTNVYSEAHLEKKRQYLKGRKQTEAQKAAIKAGRIAAGGWKGYAASEETRTKMRINSGKKKSIRDESNNIYISIAEASRKTNISRVVIWRILTKKQVQTRKDKKRFFWVS